jgi:signal transduction histidine kinase
MKNTFLRISLCIVLFFLFPSLHIVSASNWDSLLPIPLNSNVSSGKLIRYYSSAGVISTDSILTLAKQDAFAIPENDVCAIISNIEKPVWLYFKTPQKSEIGNQYLVIENANFHLINLYAFEDNTLKRISTKGMSLTYSSKNLFPEQVNFKVKPSTLYFIEAYDYYNATFPIYVRTNGVNIQKAVLKNLFNAFYWGVITVIGLIILFLFIQSKEIVFLYYALFLFGTIFLNLCLDGYAFAYFWPNHPAINSYKFALYALSALTMPLFVYHFLDVRNYLPKTKPLFLFILALFSLTCLLNISEYYTYSMYLLEITAFIQISIYIGIGFRLLSKGNKNALYFIIAWSVYLISVLLAVLSASDILPSTSYLNNYIQIGTLFQICIFSYILSGKYNEIKQLNTESQQKLIEVLRDRETALTNQKEELEHLVLLRTQEIFNKQDELHTLNGQLNEIVNQKTFELQHSLEEIVRANNQLKQFNYITSHNLRGPVASLKGLMNLYDIENTKVDKEMYISKMKIVIERMDEILSDLNKILSNKISHNLKEIISPEEIIDNNLIQFEINKNYVEVSIDPSLEISGIKSYYESIFYNLLSNSQKYAAPNRELKIAIQIQKISEAQFRITFTDNGIGMDATKTSDKLFGFYMRFHSHVEGKGLGLYITKTQIEQLGGTIRAESQLGVGTTFIIELPI